MKEYILAVCGSVVISALITLLLPEGKMGKFIGGILKLFCLLVMLMPLFQMFEKYRPWDGEVETSGECEPDENFLMQAFKLQAEMREREIEEEIAKEFSVDVDAELLWEYADYACNVTEIKIKIEDFGIYEENEHIFVIQQIEKYLLERTEQAEVTVYE